MREFNFTTNIEKRMPDIGKVFMVDRMTSDYAQAHPFDVDGFIEEVFEHWNGTESRETIRQYFNYGLGRKGEKFSTHCPAKHRDKVLKDPKTGIGQIEFGKWPEHIGGLRPSLIEAWNKGAEYHTKGFRQGDVLPAKLPACKITRLEDGGWIALFPKDEHLLSEECRVNAAIEREPSNSLEWPSVSGVAEGKSEELTTTDSTDETDNIEPVRNQSEPRQLDLFAMQTENERLRAEIEQMKQERVQSVAVAQRQTRQPRTPRPSRQCQTSAAAVAIEQTVEEPNATKNVLKFLGVLACTTLVLVLLWQTGLIIPLGLIGLATSGFLK